MNMKNSSLEFFLKIFSEVAVFLRGTRWVLEVKRSIISMTVLYSFDLFNRLAKSIASDS